MNKYMNIFIFIACEGEENVNIRTVYTVRIPGITYVTRKNTSPISLCHKHRVSGTFLTPGCQSITNLMVIRKHLCSSNHSFFTPDIVPSAKYNQPLPKPLTLKVATTRFAEMENPPTQPNPESQSHILHIVRYTPGAR
jgi:hypothetical protein